MKEYFGRDIGSYNSIFDCDFKESKEQKRLLEYQTRLKYLLNQLHPQ